MLVAAGIGAFAARDRTGRGGPKAELAAAMFVSIAAAGCGIVSLFKRRRLAAVLSIPAPLLALVSLVAAACLS